MTWMTALLVDSDRPAVRPSDIHGNIWCQSSVVSGHYAQSEHDERLRWHGLCSDHSSGGHPRTMVVVG